MASESSEPSEQLADVIRRRFPKDVKPLRRTLSASNPQESAELNEQTTNPIHCTQVPFKKVWVFLGGTGFGGLGRFEQRKFV